MSHAQFFPLASAVTLTAHRRLARMRVTIEL